MPKRRFAFRKRQRVVVWCHAVARVSGGHKRLAARDLCLFRIDGTGGCDRRYAGGPFNHLHVHHGNGQAMGLGRDNSRTIRSIANERFKGIWRARFGKRSPSAERVVYRK